MRGEGKVQWGLARCIPLQVACSLQNHPECVGWLEKPQSLREGDPPADELGRFVAAWGCFLKLGFGILHRVGGVSWGLCKLSKSWKVRLRE